MHPVTILSYPHTCASKHKVDSTLFYMASCVTTISNALLLHPLQPLGWYEGRPQILTKVVVAGELRFYALLLHDQQHDNHQHRGQRHHPLEQLVKVQVEGERKLVLGGRRGNPRTGVRR